MENLGIPAHKGGFGLGEKTETADTVIVRNSQGKRGCYTYVTFFRYTCAGTAHTINLMRSTDATTAASALAAAGTALVLTAAVVDGGGNAPASGDYVAVELAEGDWHVSTISAWNSGTKTMTLNTAIPTGKAVVAGARICFYGVHTDTVHDDYQFTTPTGATTSYPAVANGGPIVKSRTKNEPIIFVSTNGTAAGTLVNYNGVFSKAG